jgi:hypothetical protein
MNRLASIVALFVLALIAPACNTIAPTVAGSGRLVAEQREVASFTRLRVGTAIKATVIVGPDVTVQVTADDNLLGSVKTDVTAGRLDVSLSAGAQPSTEVQVAITVPNLEDLEVNSAASASATGINSSSFEAEADSAGTLTARGNADSVNVTATSAGSADVGGIPAQTATANVGSGARATVNAQISVGGSVDSGGILHIEGQPQNVNVTTNSGGAVIRD